MNITEALNAALPEIPARAIAQRFPCMPPDVVAKEHIEDGQAVVRVLVPSQDAMYRFAPANWTLIQLFNGRRSYEEIAGLHSRQAGVVYSPEEIRDFAASIDGLDFWHKTAQEKNIQLMQKSFEERQKLLKSRKSKYGDLSQILFPAVNPDKFITWLYGRTSFVYTQWFTLLTLFSFVLLAVITAVHWSEISADTVQFFNFTDKSWGDVVAFYVLALVTLCCHEIAHAHACKHYGGRVPSMGFMLIYLTPAFYTDTSEGFVKGSRYQRLVISMAGAWVELIICALATPVWWGTAPDTPVHNAAYMLMLMTGIASLLINWNPLMKLDGYHMLCEIIGIAELKEASTLYVASWVKRHVWRLPVEVPYVPKRRRLGFVVYALLSGLYSYSVMYVVARFVGNVFRNFNPDWSFIPELATAGLIFRSRIRTLVNFMKFVYLDKKDRVRKWFAARRMAMGAGILAAGLLLPVWHESVQGRFVLEPEKSVLVRNLVPGTVTGILGDEGSSVAAGAPLVLLRNPVLHSKLSRSQADLAVASMRATSATLHYAAFGAAIEERDRLTERTLQLEGEAASLALRSPISGVILTPRLQDLLQRYVPEGTPLVEVADLGVMLARIYVSEYDMYNLRTGAIAQVHVAGSFRTWTSRTARIAPVFTEMDPSLLGSNEYKGLHPPHFYQVDLPIANADGALKPGLAGVARVRGERRSALALAWQEVSRFFGRKVW
jgi:putative peptide zinc metalloprotease protein